MLNFAMESSRPAIAGWRFLWAKRVAGFKPWLHCAGCLRGPYVPEFGNSAPVNESVSVHCEPGEIAYFCGVSSANVWAHNLHLAVRVTGDPRDAAKIDCYNGDVLSVHGAKGLNFTDEFARRDYSSRGESFLTCRNFQFGAAMRAGAFDAAPA